MLDSVTNPGLASSIVDEETRAAIAGIQHDVAALKDDVARLAGALDEFLPTIRAYLDPEQPGPRGWAMRRRLAATNGN